MKYFFDTSVLMAAALSAHENHEEAKRQIDKCNADSGQLLCLSTHLIAELYATMPYVAKQLGFNLSPVQVVDTIKSIIQHMHTVTLDQNDYVTAVERCAGLKIKGAVVYDAIHYQAAVKTKADVLYTYNLKDFKRLVLEEDNLEVRKPIS